MSNPIPPIGLLLPDLMKTNAGKWALLHDATLEGVFDTARDARLAGEKLYADGLFSVQQVRNRAVGRRLGMVLSRRVSADSTTLR